MTTTRARLVADLAWIFTVRGRAIYLGEQVSIAEHMLQTAARAQAEEAPEALIVAALLHDFGHLVQDAAVDDDWHRRHDIVGGRHLSQFFGPEVCVPVHLHVEAKRYLCCVEPEYLERLSPASRRTLRLQGGPMSGEEAQDFKSLSHGREAIQLRRWDDAGKVLGITVLDFWYFAPLLEAVSKGVEWPVSMWFQEGC